jgi:AraC-like DNA-binding protein
VVGKALGVMHAEPAAAWTVEGLARQAGVSRSVFAERFTAMVGQPPMQYLALWRTQLASRLLADGGHVGAVAGSRLRIGSGVQPRVQETRRPDARRVAA